ncbi:unnamed protein product, partial [Effrenium voratum]
MKVMAMLGSWLVASVGASVSQGSCYSLATHEEAIQTSAARSNSSLLVLMALLAWMFFQVEAGTGCYNVETHICDCKVDNGSAVMVVVAVSTTLILVALATVTIFLVRKAKKEPRTNQPYSSPSLEAIQTSAARSNSSLLVLMALLAWMFFQVEAGTGCYNVETHICDCKVDENGSAVMVVVAVSTTLILVALATVTIFLVRKAKKEPRTNQPYSSPSLEAIQTSAARSNSSLLVLMALLAWMFFQVEAGTGCYNVETHICDCKVDEEDPNRGQAMLTEAENGSAVMVVVAVSTTLILVALVTVTIFLVRKAKKEAIQTSAARSNSSLLVLMALLAWMFFQVEAGTGCYNVETHICDCKVDEATCHQRQGTWTDGCNSCDASTNTHHPQCEKQY